MIMDNAEKIVSYSQVRLLLDQPLIFNLGLGIVLRFKERRREICPDR
jgi:hypothetical protein